MRTLNLFVAPAILVLAAACTPAAAPTRNPAPTRTATDATTPTESPTRTSSPTPAMTENGSALGDLTETFDSEIHGMSVMYPSGWHLRPATEPWSGDFVQQDSSFADVIYQKETDSPFIALASQPLGGRSFDDWSNSYLTLVRADDASCATALVSITVDGAAGVLADPCLVALVSDGRRGYLVWFYRFDDLGGQESVDEILATVTFQPDEAVDATPAP